MIEMAKSTLQWVKARYGQASPATKVGYGLVVVFLITLVLVTTPFFLKFQAWFTSADPLAQSIMMMFLLILSLFSIINQWERSYRVDQLKEERERVKTDLANVRKDLTSLQRELTGVEERWTRLVEVDSQEIVWQRPNLGNDNKFIPKDERKTRFVSMFNLKGGVGKTTITANIAACLALMDQPLRVLVVDIDFQGTLSDLCVDPQLIEIQTVASNTVTRLLSCGVTFENLATVAVPMNQVPKANVIIATDKLEAEDFRAQAQYFLEPKKEVRFRFQSVFHHPAISHHYDLVFFDCPPRLTTSTVNALVVSDFVIIPTKLDDSSISAVPRTLKWLDRLAGIVQAKLLGVVANETEYYDKKLTRRQANSYQYLFAMMASLYPGGTGQKKRASYERQRRATRGVLISSFPSFAHFKNCFLLCLLPLPCTIRSHDFSSTDAGKLKYFSGHLRRAVIPVHRTAEP